MPEVLESEPGGSGYWKLPVPGLNLFLLFLRTMLGVPRMVINRVVRLLGWPYKVALQQLEFR